MLGFCALSCWVIALDLVHAGQTGRQWAGIDGVYPEDQFQYLAWIRSASRHLLVSDMFVLHPTPADYLQPLIAVSGGLVALGVAPWLALLLWQPVAVLGALAAIRALLARVLPGRRERIAALALALFGGMVGTHPDLWLAFWSWGYPFALIALTAALAALLLHARAREGAAPRWPAGVLGALAAWLHPWQGESLIAIVILAELLSRRRGERMRWEAVAPTVILTSLPLVYYGALRTIDPIWQAAERYGAGGRTLGLLPWVLVPLGLPALLAYRRPAATFLARALRVWPPAAIALMVLDARFGSTATHALLGISVPLGALAVEGICSLPLAARARRYGLVAFVLLAVVPVTVDRLEATLAQLSPARGNSSLELPGEVGALALLSSDRTPGGVLSDYRLGLLVPEVTGRRVYLGDQYWSQPDWHRRWEDMFELIGGFWRAGVAQDFVRDTGARFLLEDCRPRAAWLRAELAPITAWRRRFGCVTVYSFTRAA